MLLPKLLALASLQSPWSNTEPTTAAAGSITSNTTVLIAVDLNGDGFADLVFQQRSGSTYDLKIADGDGTGRFGLPQVIGTSSYLSFATVVDLDQDGHLDVVASAVDDTRRAMGLGDGLFGPLIPLLDAPCGRLES